jgi:transposase
VPSHIRGIGRYTALLVFAEVSDITRFPDARHLCAWAGLTPTVRSSDGKARLGHISHQGSPALRWALVEATAHGGRGSGSPGGQRPISASTARTRRLSSSESASPSFWKIAWTCLSIARGLR